MNQSSKSLNYGIGLFETIRIKNGQLEYLEKHLERLMSSIDALDLSYDVSHETLGKGLQAYCQEIKYDNGVVKLVIADTSPQVTMSHRINPYKKEDYEKGFKVSVSDIKRHSSNPLLQHKTTNYWLNILVKNKADTSEEILFLNEKDEVTEGCVSNVFMIKNGLVKTPAISSGLLNGIMRQEIISTCKSLSIEVEEASINMDMLLDADGLFISNSLMGVMPVTSFLGLPKEVTPIVKQLMEVLNGT